MGILKAGIKLLFWVCFQAPTKYDEMVDYCTKQILNEM